MAYDIGNLPLEALVSGIARAEDQLARLDEIVRRSPVGEGFGERAHFSDAAASMWVAGELVHMEDLVLHDARMDVRAPTHELTIAHAIIRARRRIAGTEPGWAISERGIAALTGAASDGQQGVEGEPEAEGEGRIDWADDPDEGLSGEFADIDAIIDRSKRVLDQLTAGSRPDGPARPAIAVGDLVIRDPDWDERDRLSQWLAIVRNVDTMPSVLAAALLFDAWEALEPMQHQHWLGGQLVADYLGSRGKVVSHLPAFNVGLRAILRERRRAASRTTRLLAFLEAMSAMADAGMKEVVRLNQAREQMDRKARGRRSSSSLPAAMKLVLSRPIVSAGTVAQAAGVTQRGALALITDLGIRELTGRARYRAWGIV